MIDRRKISGRETYILDEDQLKELEDASLTGVMRDVTESIKKLEVEDAKQPSSEEDDEDPFRSLRIDD